MERKWDDNKVRMALQEMGCLFLSLVFLYTGIAKIYDWQGTKMAFHNQVFPVWMAEALVISLPPVEILAGLMLLVPKTRKMGLAASVVMMAVFTGYVGLVLTGIFGRIPCSCGGMISTLGWEEHLILNLVLLGIGVWGWRYEV